MTAQDTAVKERLTARQMLVIGVCVLINIMDGYDILAIAYTAPSIAADWGVEAKSLGFLMSMSLAGMIAGSLVLGPLADKYGRRTMILACLVLAAIGLFGSGMATDMTQLSVMRLITGIGIGGMLPAINTQVAEFSPERLRGLMIALLMTGYPAGATLGGLAAAGIIPDFGWEGVFQFGGAITLALIPLVLVFMPESPRFIEGKNSPSPHKHGTFKRLIHDHLRPLLALSMAFFATMVVFYFLVSWTPKILVNAGASLNSGISAGILMNAGGGLAVLFVGLLSIKYPIYRVTLLALALSICATVAFALVGDSLPPLMAIAFLIGIFSNSAMIGLYALLPDSFPSDLRSTATGIAIGIGRFGAVLGPILTGVMISAGWDLSSLYLVMSIFFAIAAQALLFRRNAGP